MRGSENLRGIVGPSTEPCNPKTPIVTVGKTEFDGEMFSTCHKGFCLEKAVLVWHN
jgi:hypothetical protein